MKQEEIRAFVAEMDDVQREDAYGYTLFFVGEDRRLPFATIADSDQEFDRVSDLDREEVFRLNIGVSPRTFASLIDEDIDAARDHRVLNRFMPHPDYAKQSWVCILDPVGENAERARELLVEAHAIAAARRKRRLGG